MVQLFPEGVQTQLYVGVGLLEIAGIPRVGNIPTQPCVGEEGSDLVTVGTDEGGEIATVIFIHNDDQIGLVAFPCGNSLSKFSLGGNAKAFQNSAGAGVNGIAQFFTACGAA